MKDLQSLVDALAAELGRPVGVDDRRYRVVAYSSHQDDVDPVRLASILQRQAPAEVTSWLEGLGVGDVADYLRVPANAALGMAARVCVPVRFDRTLFGYLWLIDEPEPLSERELRAALAGAEEIGAALYRVRRLEHEDQERERELLEGALAGRDEAAAELVQGGFLAAAERYAVVVLQPRRDRGRPPPDTILVRCAAAMEGLRRRVAPRHLLALVTGDHVAGVLALHERDDLEGRGAALLAAAERALDDRPDWSALVGVGDPCDSPADAGRSYEQAQLAVRVAGRVPGWGALATWAGLGAYRTVALLAQDRDVASLLPASLERLLASPDGEALAATLECYLEHAGDARSAAEALFIHRSTLYGRLHRIEEIAGVDLGAGDHPFELHLGLRLWRLGGGVSKSDAARSTSS